MPAGADVVDVEGIAAGGSLTVTGLVPEDRISVRNQGSGAGQIGYDSTTFAVSFGSLQFGTASGTPGTYTITFDANVTADAVAALVENLTYSNISDTPTLNRTLNLVLNDGTVDGVAVPLTVTVNAENDAPVNTVQSPQTVDEDLAHIFSSGNGNAITVGDVDGNSVEVTLTVTHGLISLGGTNGLTFAPGGDIDPGTNETTMTFTGTIADVNVALDGLTYAPTAGYIGSATLQIVTSDLGNTGVGGPLADFDTISLNVQAVNDAPTADIVPLSYSATEQIVLSLKGSGLVVDDLDSAAGLVTVVLAVTAGALTVNAGTSGATVVSGNGTGTVLLSGTVAQINALLTTDANSTVDYLNSSDTPGATATLTLSIDDNGNTGTGGNLTASDTATINITPVYDAPVADHDAYATNEDTAVALDLFDNDTLIESGLRRSGSTVSRRRSGKPSTWPAAPLRSTPMAPRPIRRSEASTGRLRSPMRSWRQPCHMSFLTAISTR